MIPETQTKQANILLLACYELGHQPLSLGWPLAVLAQANLDAQGVDLAVEPFPHKEAANASFVGIAVPMHTAMRIGVQAAEQVRASNPQAHICFYGLYAGLNAEYLLNGIADSVIAGEFEEPLLALIQRLKDGGNPTGLKGISTSGNVSSPYIERLNLPLPSRNSLPLLDKYAHYTHGNKHTLAGYVEASRGCLHTCQHCPIVPIYQGRFFIVPVETVMADIRQQAAAGARHITFGDPDFLNGPGHALKITRLLHQEFPQMTFDFTTKVEHILEKQTLFPELAQLGCTLIVSAFEGTREHILQRLEKGHTIEDMALALEILAKSGIAVQPTWMPFTPWTSLEDYLHLLSWIRDQNLIPNVPAVQLSVRMLVPPNSALLQHPDRDTWAGPLDPENFSHHWAHPDPRMDALQTQVASLAEQAAQDDPYIAFSAIEELAYKAAGQTPPVPVTPQAYSSPPRLSEHWFC